MRRRSNTSGGSYTISSISPTSRLSTGVSVGAISARIIRCLPVIPGALNNAVRRVEKLNTVLVESTREIVAHHMSSIASRPPIVYPDPSDPLGLKQQSNYI